MNSGSPGQATKDSPRNSTHEECPKDFIIKSYANPRIELPKTDHRSGFQKLKDIIFDLRDKGYREGDSIPYEDVEDSIFENCGIDHRTVKKYLETLVKLAYLKPIGPPKARISRVSVQTKSSIHPKTYYSQLGYTEYQFGVFAPKPTMQIPLSNPPSEIDERSLNMEKMCARVSRGQGDRTEALSETRERVRRIEERENTVAHTHILSKQEPRSLNSEQMRILRVAVCKRTGQS